MQATDTATDRDFARKAATAARWAGKALWIVIRAMTKTIFVLFIGIATFVIEMMKQTPNDAPEVSLFGIGPGPAPGEPGHNHMRWTDYHYLDEE